MLIHRRKVYEGRKKVLYEGPSQGLLVQHFKDSPGDNMEDEAESRGKGALDNRVSELLMTRLSDLGVPTHFVKRLNMREQLVRGVDMVPLVFCVRNYAAGKFATRMGLKEGTCLPQTLVETYFKQGQPPYSLVSEEHIQIFEWVDMDDLEEMVAQAMRINDILSGMFLGAGMLLYDIRLEFGYGYDEDGSVDVLLADEITPDTFRVRDVRTKEFLSLDPAREQRETTRLNRQEIAKRLGILTEV